MKYDAVSRNFEADGEFRLTDLDKALEINPKLDQPYYNRGMVYSKKKQYNEAILDFNIKKRPWNLCTVTCKMKPGKGSIFISSITLGYPRSLLERQGGEVYPG